MIRISVQMHSQIRGAAKAVIMGCCSQQSCEWLNVLSTSCLEQEAITRYEHNEVNLICHIL